MSECHLAAPGGVTPFGAAGGLRWAVPVYRQRRMSSGFRCALGRECCEGETVCCAVGDVCCGDECCDEDRCCGNGECCAEECEECLDNGSLSGGAVSVVPQVVCIGQTITFTVEGAVDSGGLKRVDCSSTIDLPAVEPSYTWVITKPDSTTESGSGASADVTADQAGVYSCIFTATANRDCPPADLNVGPATKATGVCGRADA